MNKVFLMGHLGGNPELQHSKAGKPYARLSLATNRRWTAGEEAKEATDWHSVFVWGRLAEQCVTSLQKGALILVEGSLTYWKMEDAQGFKYKNAIHGHEVRFLNSRMVRSEMPEMENDAILDNPEDAGNHNAVAHLS